MSKHIKEICSRCGVGEVSIINERGEDFRFCDRCGWLLSESKKNVLSGKAMIDDYKKSLGGSE